MKSPVQIRIPDQNRIRHVYIDCLLPVDPRDVLRLGGREKFSECFPVIRRNRSQPKAGTCSHLQFPLQISLSDQLQSQFITKPVKLQF
jgi:hypothetical protein